MIITLLCVENHISLTKERGIVYAAKFVTAPSKLYPISISTIGELTIQSDKPMNFEVGKEYDIEIGVELMNSKAGSA